jgi:hypothetical protein
MSAAFFYILINQFFIISEAVATEPKTLYNKVFKAQKRRFLY